MFRELCDEKVTPSPSQNSFDSFIPTDHYTDPNVEVAQAVPPYKVRLWVRGTIFQGGSEKTHIWQDVEQQEDGRV